MNVTQNISLISQCLDNVRGLTCLFVRKSQTFKLNLDILALILQIGWKQPVQRMNAFQNLKRSSVSLLLTLIYVNLNALGVANSHPTETLLSKESNANLELYAARFIFFSFLMEDVFTDHAFRTM